MNKNSLRTMVFVGLLSVTKSYADEQKNPVTPVTPEVSSLSSTLNTVAQPGQYVASKVAEVATSIAANTNAALLFEAISVTGIAYIVYNLLYGNPQEEDTTY